MDLHVENRVALEYYSSQGRDSLGQSHHNQTSVKKTKILFDDSHGELLTSQASEELCRMLTDELNYEVSTPESADGVLLSYRLLEEKGLDVIFLAAPTQAFSTDEIKTLTRFVRAGKSLLIATNYDSLQKQVSRSSINQILEPFGLCAQQLVSYPHDKVRSFSSHYLSSKVRRLAIKDPAYFKVLDHKMPDHVPQIVATLPETEKPFLAAVEAKPGRLVAVGDYSFFEDSNIQQDSNRLLVLNLFRWLAYQNALDFGYTQITPEIRYGKTGIFSISLINSYLREQLDGVQCVLESDSVAVIENSQQEMRPILPEEQSQMKWLIEPQQLGLQSLSLKVELPEKFKHPSLSLDPAIQFKCVPDAEISFVIHNTQGKIQEIVETGIPFEVEAVIRWEMGARQIPLQIALQTPAPEMIIEAVTNYHWRLTALTEGNWLVTLHVKETDQKITRLIHVAPSPKFQIAKVERDIVSALEVKIHHRITQIWERFDIEEIRKIPFQLLTPEDFVREVYPSYIQERLLEALQAARNEAQEFIPLVDELLFYIAPVYSPKHGCCIPYDPNLASHLVKKYELREENVAYNFLCVEGHKLYGQTWLEGNLASLLLHEKYGHGFFYTQTKLGKQLAILYRHGLLRKVDYEELKSPYLRALHEEYGQVIQILNHSALLLNEGFSTWVELTGLQQFPGFFEETLHRRREFLFRDTQLGLLTNRSVYFKKFNPGPGSKYQIKYEQLKEIYSFFSMDMGFRCVMDAVIKAADVDFGITEHDGQIQFGLEAGKIQELLLDERRGYETGADIRMNKIWEVLKNYVEQLQNENSWLDWQRSCLHFGSPVNKIVEEKLGW